MLTEVRSQRVYCVDKRVNVPSPITIDALPEGPLFQSFDINPNHLSSSCHRSLMQEAL